MNSPNSLIKINTGKAYIEYIRLNYEKTKFETNELLIYSDNVYNELFKSFDDSIKVSATTIVDFYEKNTIDKWIFAKEIVSNNINIS